MEIADITGWSGGFLICVMQMPQLIKTYQSRDVSGLSWGMLILHYMSGMLWLTYGIVLNLTPIYVSNTFFLVTTGGIMYMKFTYSKSSAGSVRSVKQTPTSESG